MIEDELRAAMQAHDHEAPTAGGLRPVVRRDRRAPAVAATVLAIAAVVVAVTLLWSRGSATHAQPAGALACPTTYGKGTVPAAPSGFDGTTRLAPAGAPAAAVICAYPGAKGAAPGQRAVTGNLQGLADTLASQPQQRAGHEQICLQYISASDGDNYLLALTYPGGTEWVSIRGNHCAGATNGEFTTYVNLRAYAAAAYQSGRWPAIRSTAGRLGQETAMVPPGPISVQITVHAYDGTKEQTVLHGPDTNGTIRRGFDELVGTLNRGGASGPMCDPTTLAGGYTLGFGYASGPGVTVEVYPTCRPGVGNGVRHSDNAAEVITRITKLLSLR